MIQGKHRGSDRGKASDMVKFLRVGVARDWSFGFKLYRPSETRLLQSELWLFIIPPFYLRVTWRTET